MIFLSQKVLPLRNTSEGSGIADAKQWEGWEEDGLPGGETGWASHGTGAHRQSLIDHWPIWLGETLCLCSSMAWEIKLVEVMWGQDHGCLSKQSFFDGNRTPWKFVSKHVVWLRASQWRQRYGMTQGFWMEAGVCMTQCFSMEDEFGSCWLCDHVQRGWARRDH